MAYQVYRQPRKTAAPPLEFPSPAVVDLRVSGIGSDVFFGPVADLSQGEVIVMFRPSGGVDRVLVDGMIVPKGNTIFFLIGRGDQFGDALARVNDSDSLWIGIRSRTGAISAAENGLSPSDAAGTLLTPGQRILESLRLINTSTGLGAR